MGRYINDEGQFQSGKYPNLAPDKIVLSFDDPAAKPVLMAYTFVAAEQNMELCEDIQTRLADKTAYPLQWSRWVSAAKAFADVCNDEEE